MDRRGFAVGKRTVNNPLARRPERTVYTLTDTGRDQLVTWMRDLVSAPAKEYRQFEAALALIVVLPPEQSEQPGRVVAEGPELHAAKATGGCASTSTDRRDSGH